MYRGIDPFQTVTGEGCRFSHLKVPAHPEEQNVVQCLSLSVGEVEGSAAHFDGKGQIGKLILVQKARRVPHIQKLLK